LANRASGHVRLGLEQHLHLPAATGDIQITVLVVGDFKANRRQCVCQCVDDEAVIAASFDFGTDALTLLPLFGAAQGLGRFGWGQRLSPEC